MKIIWKFIELADLFLRQVSMDVISIIIDDLNFMVEFKKKWYINFLITFLIYCIFIRTYQLILLTDIIHLIHVIICLFMFYLLYSKSKYTIIVVKIWSILLIIGGILSLISIFAQLAIFNIRPERANKTVLSNLNYILNVSQLIVGTIFLLYLKESITLKKILTKDWFILFSYAWICAGKLITICFTWTQNARWVFEVLVCLWK